MSFAISDKVVCIEDALGPAGVLVSGYPRVKKGVTYVIRDVWTEPRSREGYLVQLVGFPEHRWASGMRCGWTPARFRKLEDIKVENARTHCHDNRKPEGACGPEGRLFVSSGGK